MNASTGCTNTTGTVRMTGDGTASDQEPTKRGGPKIIRMVAQMIESTTMSSDETAGVMRAIGKVQATVRTVKKDGKNPFFKSKYATIESVLDSLMGATADAGLVVTQWPDGDALTTIVCHTLSGEFVRTTIVIAPKEPGPQAHGGALTYMRRYSLVAIFMLAQEDDDGEAAEGRQRAPTTDTSTKKPAPKRAVDGVRRSQCDDLKKKITAAGDMSELGEIKGKYSKIARDWGKPYYKEIVAAFEDKKAELSEPPEKDD